MSTSPRRALVVIDVQNEYVTGNLLIDHPPVSESLAHIALAMDTAHAFGIPIAVARHGLPEDAPLFATGSHGWSLHEVVAGRHRDHLIDKTRPSVYTGTDFADWLAGHAVDTLTVVGFMTHNCNASTVFEAMHRGLTVEHLSDATGSPPYANDAGSATAEEIHRVFNVVFHSNFAAVATTRQWVDAVRDGVALECDSVPASYRRGRALSGRD